MSKESIILKVESDGTPEGTFITDSLGRTLDNVIDVKFGLNATELPTVTIELVGVEVSINTKPRFTDIDKLVSEESEHVTVKVNDEEGKIIYTSTAVDSVVLPAENI